MTLLCDGANTKAEATVAAVDTGDWTFIGWAYPTSTGEGNNGTVFNCSSGISNPRQRLKFQDVSAHLIAQQLASGANGNAITNDTLSMSTWYCLAATFRASDAKCRVYIGTPTATMKEATYSTQAVMTTRSTGGTTYCAGNMSDQTTTWGGSLGPQCFDTREWSLAEMEYFRFWQRPPSMPTLRIWLPLYGSYATEPDLTGRTTGAVVSNGALGVQFPGTGPTKLIVPSGRRLR